MGEGVLMSAVKFSLSSLGMGNTVLPQLTPTAQKCHILLFDAGRVTLIVLRIGLKLKLFSG